MGLSSSAYAIALNDPGVVGTVTDGAPSSIADETIYVNTLLGLGANVTQTIAGEKQPAIKSGLALAVGSLECRSAKRQTANGRTGSEALLR